MKKSSRYDISSGKYSMAGISIKNSKSQWVQSKNYLIRKFDVPIGNCQ